MLASFRCTPCSFSVCRRLCLAVSLGKSRGKREQIQIGNSVIVKQTSKHPELQTNYSETYSTLSDAAGRVSAFIASNHLKLWS